jgi:hypothetical protein
MIMDKVQKIDTSNCSLVLGTVLPYSRSWSSSVSIVSDYGLDDQGLILDRGWDFSSSLCVQTGSGAHQAYCTMGAGYPFPGGKARPGHDADHSPPPSAEVKNV